MRSILVLLLLATLCACSKPPEETSLGDDVPMDTTPVAAARPTTRPAASQPSDDLGEGLPARIAAAHGVTTWRTKEAFAADIVVEYSRQEVLRGELIYQPNTTKTRMTLDNGSTLIWDGEQAWAFPASRAKASQVRFHLRAWPFLMAAPFKFIDPGANFTPQDVRPMLWQECETGLITYDPGVGDTPEDWFHIYAQPDTDRLLGMGYLVTYNTKSKTREEAERALHSNAHALIFETFEEVDGVVLPSYWRIHRWHRGRPAGDRLGSVTLENMRFITPDPGTFVAPPDAKPDPLVVLPMPEAPPPPPSRIVPKPPPPAAPPG